MKKIYDSLEDEQIYSIDTIYLDSTIVTLLNEINSRIDKFNLGFYFRNSTRPFLLNNEVLFGKDKEYTIRTIDDLVSYIKNGNIYKITDTFSLNESNIKLVTKFIYTTVRNNVEILKYILEFYESQVMAISHNEADIVQNDTFNISNDYILVNPIALEYTNVIHYITSHIAITDVDTIDMLNMLNLHVIETINKHIDINDDKSIQLKLIGNNINIIKGTPPSSRRYKLNVLLQEHNIDDKIDDLDSSNFESAVIDIETLDAMYRKKV